MDSNLRAPKITKEQLMDECKLLGTSKDAITKISEKYSLTYSTICCYIRSWGVRKELTQDCSEDSGIGIREYLQNSGNRPEQSNVINLNGSAAGNSVRHRLKCSGFTGKLASYHVIDKKGIHISDLKNPSCIIKISNLEDFIAEIIELQSRLSVESV